MSDELLIRCASPTLAGIKTGNIFTCRFDKKEKLMSYIRYINQRIGHKGIRAIPLRIKDDSALIYLYRPDRLKKDLDRIETRMILAERGYKNTSVSGCLAELINRLTQGKEFPHEIGLFIGYPPEDVRGFIKKQPDCKFIGCWKVYGDECEAKKIFNRFHRCREIYQRQFHMGKSIDNLTVSVS